MPQPWSRSKPWPYDLLIEPATGPAVGVRLRPGENGQMVGQRSRRVDAVSPSTYDQGALNPYIEKPFVMGRLEGGMGEVVQRSATTTRYKVARGVDASIGGIRRLGPEFVSQTVPAIAAAPKSVLQVLVGPGVTDQVFALRGREVDRYSAGVFLLSKDFGPADLPSSAVRFNGNLMVATGGGALWQYDGITPWAAAVLPVGALATQVERIGEELYIGGGDEIRVLTAGADPLLAASWGGAIQVGDLTGTIVGLKGIGGVLFVYKTDGLYSLNPDASVNELTPEFRGRAAGTDVWSGRNAASWDDALWFGYGDAYYRMDAGATYTPIGPERLVENNTDVRGVPVSGAGHAGWFFYLAVYNATTTDSHLLKYGTWAPGQDGAAYRFGDAWHGALKSWTAKQVTRIDVTYLDGAPRLWVGFTDGTIELAVLPTRTPDPAQDSACRFQTTGYTDWPDHHGEAQGDNKHWRRIAASGPNLAPSTYLQVNYSVDGAAPVAGGSITASGASLIPSAPVVGKLIRVQEQLIGTATATPQVESVVLYEQVRPVRLELEYACVAVASNRVARRDGVVDRRSADQIRAALQATAGPGPTTVWMPDGTHQDVDFVSYGEAIPNPDARYGVEWDVPLALVQWRDTP